MKIKLKLNTCKNYSLYAYLLMTYVMASAIYLIITLSYGTPFKDAVSKHPELVEIKQESKRKRRNAFLIGLGVSILALFIFRPYGSIF